MSGWSSPLHRSHSAPLLKLLNIVGARPQFIKVAPVLRAIGKYNETHSGNPIREILVHTGQHYDYEMSQVFFDELGLKDPDYHLGVGSGSHGQQTGEMLKRIEEVLSKEKPDIVMVYGDTNSTLAGALAAAKLHIPVAHIEAGLRSFNKRMPEEVNRILTDHISDFLFCPTETAVQNLKREGFTNVLNDGHLLPIPFNEGLLPAARPVVVNTGDVMYDAVLQYAELAESKSTILYQLHLVEELSHEREERKKPNERNRSVEPYVLATVHRAENTNDPERLKSIFEALVRIAKEGLTVVFPIHPRTRKAAEILGLSLSGVRVLEPVSYLDMLILEKHARVILTDSGGVQKEAFFFKVPCVTLREETEWVETVKNGWNVLAGCDTDRIVQAVLRFSSSTPLSPLPNASAPPRHHSSALQHMFPYGEGHAAEQVIDFFRRL